MGRRALAAVASLLTCGVVVASPAWVVTAAASAPQSGAELQKVPGPAKPLPFTPTPALTEFQGLSSSETYNSTTYYWAPGEPTVAVGQTDIVQTANEAAAVYDKSGNKLAEFDFGTFWPGGSPSNPVQCTDPRALYIATADRFAISCSSSSMLFAISKTDHPTAASDWNLFAAPNTSFLDQDKIEATSDKFIIAGNTSTNEQIYVYNLTDVVNGVSKPAAVKVVAKKSNIYEAVVQQTATNDGYFVSSFPGNLLYLASIAGTPASSDVTISETVVKSADYPAPQEPSVPGGHIGGALLDGRVYDAVYEVETSDSQPVIQYSSARECGARTCLTNARISLSGTKPVLAYDNLVGEPGYDYSYGAVGLDGSGSVFELYTQTSATQTPAAAMVGPGFDVVVQTSGAATNSCQSGHTPPCDERWGDYFGTAIDPSDAMSVWVTGTYQATSGDYGWSTVIARVSASAFSLPTVTTSTASKVKTTSAVVNGTVNPNSVATTYHFDYGLTTGYDTATVETSAGSGTSAVPVSAALTGLQENTLYHYRVVATTSVGRAVGPDKTFRTAGPKITSVTFTGGAADPIITIIGSNFGTLPAGTPAGCGATGDVFGTSLWLDDLTNGWTAGVNGDCIGLLVSTYTSTHIVYQLGSFYDDNAFQLNGGDAYKVVVLGKSLSGTVTYS